MLAGAFGCSYGMKRQSSGLPRLRAEGPTRIFVPVVDNLTTRTGFEPSVTNALRSAMGGVGGIQLARTEDEADYVLLASVTKYLTLPATLVSGNAATENIGGLRNPQLTAGAIALTLGMRAQLIERVPNGAQARRVLWERPFEESAAYEASSRFYESGTVASRREGGSSSAPYINDSRESLQLRALADRIALQVTDQVVQDF